jgi:hypothetical protein
MSLLKEALGDKVDNYLDRTQPDFKLADQHACQ